MDDVTGLTVTKSIERLQVERVIRPTAQVGDDMRPVGWTEPARRPVYRVMTPVIEYEAQYTTAAIAACHPAQLNA